MGLISTPSAQQMMASQYATPAMVPLQRRSEYLANALEAMQGAGQNLRTPAALGTNLLADALLQFGQRRNDNAILTQAGKDRQSLADMVLGNHAQQQQPQQQAQAPMGAMPGGATPAVPDMSMGGGAQAPSPAAPQAPANDYSAVPMQTVTPQEWAQARTLMSNPATFQQGIQMAMQLRQREASPAALSPGYTYNPDGSVRNLQENWQQIPGMTPADSAQRNTVTNQIQHQAIPGVQGPNGSFLTNNGYETPPTTVNGQVLPYGAPTPDQLMGTVRSILTDASSPVATYRSLVTKARPILEHPEDYQNGIGDIALTEAVQEAMQANPNLAVREGFVHTIQESQGWAANLVGQAQNAISRGQTGVFTPDQRSRMIRIIQNATDTRYQEANDYVGELQRGATPLGYPPETFPSLVQPPPRAIPHEPSARQPQATGPMANRAPPRAPAGMNAQQAQAWAQQQNLQPGDTYVAPDGSLRQWGRRQ